ncbi:hypothetical protein [Roseixanthobacter glucoisosaccharinicivorans]|uniref:hypothetical protein n=1 Tax=Roseixanthobacter glucoisosaccharinicivorans TaxID=3119923 RepID=UPI00372889AC
MLQIEEVGLRYELAVFNTDQVNKKRIKFPASALMRSDETHRREAFLAQAPVGTPAHMQHDMHRVVGWSRQLGHYIDGEMVRVLGCIEYPETEEDRAALQDRVARHRKRINDDSTAPYRRELTAKLGFSDDEDLTFIRMEAVFAKREGLAAKQYPEFFTPNSVIVDKDGLVDFDELLARTTELAPGVFHDKKRDLVLVAHRFFRRRLSHLNALNTEFLSSFSGVATGHANLRARLRLDPDLLGDPASTKGLIELEYWRGPKYDDDINKIPNGVAEHKADEQTRLFEGVDRTQIWWKGPETRTVGSTSAEYRTFEVEELIEDPSSGLANGQYGCRYAHAEYSADAASITHFDGAIRAYEGAQYLARFEASIDRAGKQSDYSKLFRFDGALSIFDWKRLLSDYYRGNNLIPEYLGAPGDVEESRSAAESTGAEELAEAPLAAFISLLPEGLSDGATLYPEQLQQIGTENFPFVEVGVGEVATYLITKCNLDVMAIGFRDDILNLSRFGIGRSRKSAVSFTDELSALAAALRKDVESGIVRRVAIPIMWDCDGLVITLTIAGDASLVLSILQQLPALVAPDCMPSEWIESLVTLIQREAPMERAPIIWEGVERGVLAIERQGNIEAEFILPGPLKDALISSGALRTTVEQNGQDEELDA